MTEKMNPRAVLQRYLELCSSDISSLANELASNAVLEYNGITIKGIHKIIKFIRQKHNTGMVQSFWNAKTVEPFEERESHLSTKTIPPENLESLAISDDEMGLAATEQTSPSSTKNEFDTTEDLSYETPPRTLPAALHPPPLTAGRRFMPFSSDEEESSSSSPSPTLQSKHSSSSTVPSLNVYSDLRYLEAVGTLRTANEPKHRGTRTTHHIPPEDTSAHSSSGGSPSTPGTPRRSSGYTENRTKLKLSYRTRGATAELQFALIIYEHTSTRSSSVRRNLFNDQQAIEFGDEQHVSPTCPRLDDSPQPTPLPVTPPEESPPQPAPPEETAAVQTTNTRRTPPGTPIKRRRFPHVIAGIRTSPRRRPRPPEVDDFLFVTGASSSSNMSNVSQSCTRKTHTTDRNVCGSAAKSRKLSAPSSSGLSTVRKPLRF